MQKQQIPLKNSLLLLLAAIIWGIAFVAQSVGMKYVGGFTFNAVRSLIGAVVLIPLIFILKKRNSPSDSASKASGRSDTSSNTVSNMQEKKTLIIGGIACGICLCLASNFQQFGIKYTTVGKAGFITACYIVIVPVIGLFLGKKCTKFIWAAVAMALIGLYLLCITDVFSIGKGDLLVLVCAFLFSLHILVIDSGTLIHLGSMAANPLRRCYVMRSSLHLADYRSEKHEPNCSIPDTQPGILHLCPSRMDHPQTATKY